MRKLQYSEELISRVVTEYGEWPEVHELAREGKFILGMFLARGASQQMSPEDIVDAFERGDAEAVLENARAAMRRKKLHVDWMKAVLSKMSDDQVPDTNLERSALVAA